jgi:hypothetical protein
MTAMNLRSILAPLVGVAICVLSAQRPGAALRERPLEHLSARAVSVADSRPESQIDILIDRWSTDGEWKAARDAMINGGPLNLIDALHHLRGRVGVVLMPGVQASGARARQRTPRNLLFAREIRAAAGRRLILVGDQHFGIGESRREARVDRDEFTLLDVRFGPDGTGIGKLASAANVRYDVATQTIEMDNYGAQPARLVDVRVEDRDENRSNVR